MNRELKDQIIIYHFLDIKKMVYFIIKGGKHRNVFKVELLFNLMFRGLLRKRGNRLWKIVKI